MMRFDEYLKIGSAAKFLGVTQETMRNYERQGKLVPHRHPINNYRLYRQEDLETLLDLFKRYPHNR